MPPADARFESRDQVLIAKNRVQVGGRSRHCDLAHAPVDATRQMGKQSSQSERGQFPDRADRVFELAEFLLEPAELSPPVGTLGRAREEDAGDPRLCVGRRTIRDRQNAPCLEVLAFRGILNLALTVERRADRIGKGSAWILDARIAEQVDVVLEAVIQTRECAIALRTMRVEFLDAG